MNAMRCNESWNVKRLLPKIVEHCESFIMKYSGALYHFILAIQRQCFACMRRIELMQLCHWLGHGLWYMCDGKQQQNQTLDSGTINETHEYILKDISINSRSKSKLYCTRSDADNFQAFMRPIQGKRIFVSCYILQPT